jgi:alanine dehydrogenase
VLVFDAARVQALASMPALIEALREAFRDPPCQQPPRHALTIPGGRGDRLFLTMPAFGHDGGVVVKLATVYTDNVARGFATIQGAIVVFSAHGAPIAVLDGAMVTRLRTAAASALASSYLSRPDSAKLTLLGTGALAPWMAAAHATVRQLTRIVVWGRRAERVAETIAATRALVAADVRVEAAPSLDAAIHDADIVSSATSSSTPLVRGDSVREGTFIDLVGSFSPEKRECDDDAIRVARVFVDTFEGALSEAGDLLDPMARGVIARDHVKGELTDLVRGTVKGREDDTQVTLFKSVGSAIEDFAAARSFIGNIRVRTD